ncbi:UNKNOWN [Stylonychia lemnae]|uniref:Uncharacterized protein n=1 Tax=Stylonychia lemnae TaxID=5949 RepID=A0A077ZWC0_STYLE|nr:UNKNOWN [Stylonychia lemnae]|eukprot:CDW72741.1 UNKNOWN [Stylonychia lemnae]
MKVALDKPKTQIFNSPDDKYKHSMHKSREDSTRRLKGEEKSQKFKPLIQVKKQENFQMKKRMSILLQDTFNFQHSKKYTSHTPKLNLASQFNHQNIPTVKVQAKTNTDLQHVNSQPQLSLQENQAQISKFLKNVENCRKKFQKDTKRFNNQHNQFKNSVNELEEFVDFKILNPYEKFQEEVRQELLDKSHHVKPRNFELKKQTKVLNDYPLEETIRAFDGYIDLDSGVLFNKDVSRKLIESSIKEEQSKKKNYTMHYL